MRRSQRPRIATPAAVDEIDGRDLRIGDRWLTDFASGSYLGLDIDEEIVDTVPDYLARWGTQAAWRDGTALHEQLRAGLLSLLGAGDLRLSATIGQAHATAIPALAGAGTVFLPAGANRSLRDGAALARARGATLRVLSGDLCAQLEPALRGRWPRPGVVCVDGVDPLHGNPAPLARLAALAAERGAVLYVDDAHGFGVLGERSPWELCGYGIRGGGTAAHLDRAWEGLVVAGSLSRAYSSPVAFVAAGAPETRALAVALAGGAGGGPLPIATLATAIEGLGVNARRGDQLRARLHALTGRVLRQLRDQGALHANRSGFPIVSLAPARSGDARQLHELLRDRGIYAAIAPSPGSGAREAVLRLTLSAAHTDEQIEHLERVLAGLAASFKLAADPAD